MARVRKRHAQVAEINVVPYIDVTLVLLIIFMVTTPLLVQGVQVDLPQASTTPVEPTEEKPLVVSIEQDGTLYLTLGSENDPVSADEVQDGVEKVLRRSPQTPVYVRGHRNVAYGEVVELMAVLQAAGAPSVGLLTEEPAPR